MQNYGNWPYYPNEVMGPYRAYMTNQNMNQNMNQMVDQMMNQNMMQQNMTNMQQQQQQVGLSEALDLMVQAVKGETEDRMFYDYLINAATSPMDKEIIRGIRDNEINHAKMFRQMYYEHTGKMIPPDKDVTFEQPSSYCDGLRRALMGETNAVIKYRKILFAMKERSHINMLTEIITDELRHGILYNFLIHSNDCKY